MRPLQRREYDLHAWAAARLGIRNLDGGRGYDQGVRIVSCPLCDDAMLDRGRGWVNVQRRSCGCFNSGCPAEGGMGALEYVQRVEGYRTKTEALGMLLRDYPSWAAPVVQVPRRSTYDDWCELPPSIPIREHPGCHPSPVYDMVRAFLTKQWGLTTRDAEFWELRYCVQGHHAWRIIIPIMMTGQLVGFQARSFRGGEPKYVTSQHGERGERFAECGRPAEAMLFNLDAVQEGDDVILVEGAADAMALDKTESARTRMAAETVQGRGAGCSGHDREAVQIDDPTGDLVGGAGTVPVAVLGLALTDEKAALLALRRPGRVIVAADEEPDAQARGRKMMLTLHPWGIDVTTGHWIGGKDAGTGARLRPTASELHGTTALAYARMHR